MKNGREEKPVAEHTALNRNGSNLTKKVPELFSKEAWLKVSDLFQKIIQGTDASDQLCANNDSETIRAYCDIANLAAEHPDQIPFYEKTQERVEQVNVRAHQDNLQKKQFSIAFIEKLIPVAAFCICVWGETTGKFKISKLLKTVMV